MPTRVPRFEELDRKIRQEQARELNATPYSNPTQQKQPPLRLREPLEQQAREMRRRNRQERAAKHPRGATRYITIQTNAFMDLCRAVADLYEIPAAELLAHSQIPSLAHARWIVYEVLRRELWPVSKIGRQFHMHHTSVLYALEKIAEHVKSSPELDAIIENLRSHVKKPRLTPSGFPLPSFARPLSPPHCP
jgi:hypothetical protein